MANEYITMSDETTLTINTTDTLDLDINHHYGHTIDISNITTSTINTTGFDDLIAMDDISITLTEPVEFEDHMPDVAKVEDMCNDYPALKQAYEKFKTIYAMVHQDWQGRQDAENEPPF
jgi:hypothetical protein